MRKISIMRKSKNAPLRFHWGITKYYTCYHIWFGWYGITIDRIHKDQQ